MDSCLRRCKTEVDNCQWYSHNGANLDCYLFSTCDQLDESEVDYISGQVECKTSGIVNQPFYIFVHFRVKLKIEFLKKPIDIHNYNAYTGL
jgi:hypothetical protein